MTSDHASAVASSAAPSSPMVATAPPAASPDAPPDVPLTPADVAAALDPSAVPDGDYWMSLSPHLRSLIRNALPIAFPSGTAAPASATGGTANANSKAPAPAPAVPSVGNGNSAETGTGAGAGAGVDLLGMTTIDLQKSFVSHPLITVARQLAEAAHASQLAFPQGDSRRGNDAGQDSGTYPPFDPGLLSELAAHPEALFNLRHFGSPRSPAEVPVTLSGSMPLANGSANSGSNGSQPASAAFNVALGAGLAAPDAADSDPYVGFMDERGPYAAAVGTDGEASDARLGPIAPAEPASPTPPPNGKNKKKKKKKKSTAAAFDTAAPASLAPSLPIPNPALAPAPTSALTSAPEPVPPDAAPPVPVQPAHSVNSVHPTAVDPPPKTLPPSSRAAGKQPMVGTGKSPATAKAPSSAAAGKRPAVPTPTPAPVSRSLGKDSTALQRHPSATESTASTANLSVNNRLWATNSQEERQKIREFWLGLEEDERRDLVMIEKDAVLRKIKEQQKHLCTCGVCGRKRSSIEEELDLLYQAYYKELETYTTQQLEQGCHGDDVAASGPFPGSVQLDANGVVVGPDPLHPSSRHNRKPRRVEDEYDDEDEFDDDDFDDEEFDEEEEEDAHHHHHYHHHQHAKPPLSRSVAGANPADAFGSAVTVKGGILTVADDLLKNDGQKFLEMMEQLANRRAQREAEVQAQLDAEWDRVRNRPRDYDDGQDDGYDNGDEEYDPEDELDDEEDFEDQEDDESLTEEQRMEEGRRMFQIFAARMFEQRVLQAYREHVAQDRQQQLLRELEASAAETRDKAAKRERDNQRRKDRRRQQREQREAELMRQEQERQAKAQADAEAKAKRRDAELKRQRELRERRETERKAKEEEKARKEEERRKRLEEERAREAEKERVRKEKEEEGRQQREAARQAKEAKDKEKLAEERQRQHAQDLRARAEAEKKTALVEQHTREAHRAAAFAAKPKHPPVPISPSNPTDRTAPSPAPLRFSSQSPSQSTPTTPGRSVGPARSASIGFGLPPRPTTTMGPPPGMNLPPPPGAAAPGPSGDAATSPAGPMSPTRSRTTGPGVIVPSAESRSASVSTSAGGRASGTASGLTTPALASVPRGGSLGSAPSVVPGSGATSGTGAGVGSVGMPSFGFPPFDPPPSGNLFSPPTPGFGGLGAGLDLGAGLGLGPAPSQSLQGFNGMMEPSSPLALSMGVGIPASFGSDNLFRVPQAAHSPGPGTRLIQRPSVAPIGAGSGAVGPIRPPRHVSDDLHGSGDEAYRRPESPQLPDNILGSSALLSGADEAVEPINRRTSQVPSANPFGVPSAPGASFGGMGLGVSPWGPPGPPPPTAPTGRDSLLSSLGGTPLPSARAIGTPPVPPAGPSVFSPPGLGAGPPLAPWLRPPPASWDATRMAFEQAPAGIPPGLNELGNNLFGFPPASFGPVPGAQDPWAAREALTDHGA